MKNSITMAILSLSVSIAFGQTNENLVSNGSFESLAKDPKKLGAIENATGWYSPTGAKADLFLPSKKTPDIGTPENIYGKENPKDGSNYVGFVAFSHNNKMPRSYVSNKLLNPLKKGEKYCVQFYVAMAEASMYSSNQIGAHFSKKAFGTEAKESIIEKTHVLNENNKIFNAPYGWDQVCGTFIADGGEKFITIGNFTSNENTKTQRNKKDSKSKTALIPAAYYYLDNITVYQIDEDNPCECAKADPTDGFSLTVYQKALNITDDMSLSQKVSALSVYFGFGKTDLTDAGKDALDMIVKLMKENPNNQLQINGYSDEAEEKAAEDNSFFSGMDGKRVNMIYNYLKENGIHTTRLIASPQGSSEKSSEITANDEEDIIQAKNRRVEFKIR
ncbi:MAG: OmpA family protein [Crocinitomicaceae bacterium]|nr:OmpA family protein [Crocinitomicaceae bacterium]